MTFQQGHETDSSLELLVRTTSVQFKVKSQIQAPTSDSSKTNVKDIKYTTSGYDQDNSPKTGRDVSS